MRVHTGSTYAHRTRPRGGAKALRTMGEVVILESFRSGSRLSHIELGRQLAQTRANAGWSVDWPSNCFPLPRSLIPARHRAHPTGSVDHSKGKNEPFQKRSSTDEPIPLRPSNQRAIESTQGQWWRHGRARSRIRRRVMFWQRLCRLRTSSRHRSLRGDRARWGDESSHDRAT